MGRPKVRKGEAATTDRLLNAAEKIFGTRGYEGAKLADIAAEVGISRPSLLYHYKSKYELYVAVVQAVFDQLGRTLVTALDRNDAFEARLMQLVAAFGTFVQSRPQAARLILREVMNDQGPGHDILLEAGLPVLEMVERFVRLHGNDQIRPGLPVRAALLQLVASTFVKASSGSLERPFWGEQDHHQALTRLLFFDEK